MTTEKAVLRGKGKSTIKKMTPDGAGIRIANDFLDQLTKESISYAGSYINLINEAPFTYLERQSGGVVASALSKFTDIFLMEVPIYRKFKGIAAEKHGWIDFWAKYRDTDFFIELKQSYYSLYSNEINQEVKEAWSKGNEQITSFNKKDIWDYSVTSKIVLLSYQIIPLYVTLKSPDDISLFTDEVYLSKIHNKLVKELTPSPSWSCLWTMKDDMTENTSRYVGESVRYYPAVIFLSKIVTPEFAK